MNEAIFNYLLTVNFIHSYTKVHRNCSKITIYLEAHISKICIPAVISREAFKPHAPASDGGPYMCGFINPIVTETAWQK